MASSFLARPVRGERFLPETSSKRADENRAPIGWFVHRAIWVVALAQAARLTRELRSGIARDQCYGCRFGFHLSRNDSHCSHCSRCCSSGSCYGNCSVRIRFQYDGTPYQPFSAGPATSYEAVDKKPGSQSLSTLIPATSIDRAEREGFEERISWAQKLQHVNIASVRDLGREGQRFHFYVSERLAVITLK